MKKLYQTILVLPVLLLWAVVVNGQDCSLLQTSARAYESRCAATGSIKVTVSGGSGDYKYKVSGPVSTNYTTTDSITGLSAGTYTVYITDILTNCTDSVLNVRVPGTYEDPRFTLIKQDVTCDNVANGSITVDSIANGRAPFSFSIVAPSTSGVGTGNSTGVFNNLPAGSYSIQLRDSCGGIQTRQISIYDYTWWIEAYPFTRVSCNEVSGYILVRDIQGNTSTGSGLPGFTYGIIRGTGDTIWQTTPYFSFTLPPNAPFEIIVKDACGAIKKAWVTLYSIPSVGQDVELSDFACSTFTATVVDVINLFSPSFCLYDSANLLLGCNSTGVFSNLPYGSYCIQVKDSCTDSTFNRCFTAVHPPSSVDQAVDIRDRACSTFTAVITGQQNIFVPEYCLYTESDSLITCNATGIFTDLPYGRYCIKLTDRCTDTTITRCFQAFRPLPSIGGFSQYYLNCTTVTLTVNGDSSYHSQYCLYDTAGVLIACNSTGIFDSIPIGNYCATMYDACYDTTITYCASIPGPVLENDLNIRVRNRTCNSFTLMAYSDHVDGEFCLYDSHGNLIRCDSSGVFTNLPYGYYCVTGTISCPDTTFRTCINVERPEPSVSGNIRTSNLTCSTFTAYVSGQQNLTNPNYCLYDENDILISCNTTGIFNNLSYGRYCIKITDGCVDTTISRCFTKYPTPVSLQGIPGKSCAMGFSTFFLTFNGTNPPYNVVIYNPDQTVLQTSTYTNNNAYFDGIPGLPDSLMYTVVVADACGNSDTISLAAPFGFYRRNFTVLNKCPGATWASGSGNINGTITTNMGTIEARIISKDGVYLSPGIRPTTNNGVQVSFNDLGPGVYVVKSWENLCNRPYYDTVTIRPYQFPSLDNSSAFQCDFGGFSLSAVVANGVGPYAYEIIGSTPSTPSIIAGPQASPLFTINNGSMYSLIRLRVTDACGNASLGDASILPLALNGIVVSNDCLMQPTSLTVDNIYGAAYSWYKKLTTTSTDSTLLGNSNSVFIPQVLHSDTGVYVCYLSVNSGCIRRTYVYNLTGDCHTILPLKLQEFTGQARGTENVLQWKTQMEQDLSHFTVEKKNEAGLFDDLGRVVAAGNSQLPKQYGFVDASPLNGKTYYRLKMTDLNGDISYSNVISVSNGKKDAIYVYPNPVREQLNISFAVNEKASYSIRLYSGTGQLISTARYMASPGSVYQLKRPAGVQRGNYVLQAIDERTGTVHYEKLIFQ